MHPFNHLIAALVQQRVNNNQDTDAVAMLLELADHPQEDVSALAVAGLLRDDDLAVTWVAALLVMRRAIRWRSTWTPIGPRSFQRPSQPRAGTASRSGRVGRRAPGAVPAHAGGLGAATGWRGGRLG